MDPIDIRPARDWEDCMQCEKLQRLIWWTPDGMDVVPASLLITAQKNGGLLLGAYEGGKMVGFVFGFLGSEGEGKARRIKHCSHMLGVLPNYRGSGLGFELKKRQREFLVSQGLELATWTYDPLQAINARLNVGRLGGIVRRYLRDAYGRMLDVLNAGVPSDRFEVEWWLNHRRVRVSVEQGSGPRQKPSTCAQPIYELEFDAQDLPRVTAEAGFDSATCSVEIPADLNAVKARDLELARAWRGWTRATFESAFARNYTIVEVRTWSDDHERKRIAYILQKDFTIEESAVDLTEPRSRI